MRHGAQVAIASRSLDRVRTSGLCQTNGQKHLLSLKSILLARKLEEATGGRCLYFSMDVSKPEQVNQTVDKILEKFPRIDILVNGLNLKIFVKYLKTCPAPTLECAKVKNNCEMFSFCV